MLSMLLAHKKQTQEIDPRCICFYTAAGTADVSVYTQYQRWDGTIYYSTDGINYSEFTAGTTVSGKKLYFRGLNNTKITYGTNYSYGWDVYATGGTLVYCSGNIEHLRHYADNPPTAATYCYGYMFHEDRYLASAPSLPSTTLAIGMYQYMFYGCTNLTTAPDLPATTLSTCCYAHMFQDCVNLTIAPELPVTTLAGACYEYMFSGCSRLTTPPLLPATTLTASCYECMFEYCDSLTSLPNINHAIPDTESMYRMFAGCGSLKVSGSKGSKYPYATFMFNEPTNSKATNTIKDIFSGADEYPNYGTTCFVLPNVQYYTNIPYRT